MMKAITDVIFPCAGSPAGCRKTPAVTAPVPPYTGSEVFLSLVDQYEAPYPENLRHITITAMVTNRDLPCLIARNGRDDLTVDAAIPVAGVGLIRPPRSPQPPAG